MTFLPLVHREMRVASRRRSTFWSRAFAAGLMVATWTVLIVIAQRKTSQAQLGEMLFYTLGTLTFIYALLTGVFLTSDCLSAEKRDGTLGLLFLTDLRGFDVVLGKLAGTSLNAIYTMVGVLPLLALPLLLGGVTGWEFVRLITSLLTTLALSLCIGLYVSSRSESAGASLLITAAVLLGFTLLTLLGVVILGELGWLRDSENPLLLLSPITSIVLVQENEFRTSFGGQGYYISIGSMLTFALAALAFACYHLPRSWRKKELGIKEDSPAASPPLPVPAIAAGGSSSPASGPTTDQPPAPDRETRTPAVARELAGTRSAASPTSPPGNELEVGVRPVPPGAEAAHPDTPGLPPVLTPAESRGAGNAASEHRARLRAYRRPLLDFDPCFWLADRPLRARRAARIVFYVLLGIWLVVAAMMFVDQRDFKGIGFGCSILGLVVMNLIAKCMLAAEATRQFHEDRTSGALELLLTTPLTEKHVITGQRRALHRFWREPKLMIIAMTLLILWAMWGPLYSEVHWGEIPQILTWILCGSLVVLFLDEYALIRVGLAMGLRHRRHHRAIFATVARVLLPPWLTMLLFFFIAVAGGGGEKTFQFLLFLWFLLGGVMSLMMGNHAAASLEMLIRGDSPAKRAVPPGFPTAPPP